MSKTDYIYKYWFPRDVKEIYIIVSRDGDPADGANVWSDDYAYLDSFGDKDLLFLVYGYLCKYYPEAQIQYVYSSVDCQRDLIGKNLLVLGGPSARHGVARKFMHDALREIFKNCSGIDKPPILYSIKQDAEGYDFWSQIKKTVCYDKCKLYDERFDCRTHHEICVWKKSEQTEPEVMCLERGDITVTHEEAMRLSDKDERHRKKSNPEGVTITECIKRDIGVFIAFQNPYSTTAIKSRVIMINGAHTFGGVGAFTTFNVENNTAKSNYDELDKFLEGKGSDFIAYFPIEVDNYARTCKQCAELKAEKNFISLVTPKQQEALSSEAVEDLEALKEDIAQLDKALQRYIKAKTQLTGEAKNLHESKRVKAERLYEKVASIQTALDEIKTQSEFDLKFNALKVEFEAVRTEW